jgi:PAS domain S-box-containing protein
MFTSNSLLVRLLLVVLLALAPALGVQIWFEWRSLDAAAKMRRADALRLVTLVASEQQQIAEGAHQALTAIGGDVPGLVANPAQCHDRLAELMDRFGRYATAYLVGRDGRVVCSAIESQLGNQVGTRPYLAKALATGDFVAGTLMNGRSTGRRVLDFGQPWRDADGNVAGLIVLALDLDWLQARLEALPLPAGASASIIDSTNTIIAHWPDPNAWIGRRPGDEVAELLLAGKTGAGEATINGKRRVIAQSPLDGAGQGLAATVGLPVEPGGSFAFISPALLPVFGVVLALLVTLAGVRVLVRRPARRLMRAAARWSGGDLAARTGLADDGTEFGRLGSAFDRMAEALRAREHALARALEGTTDMVVAMDRACHFSYLNQHARQRIALGRDLVGQVLWEIYPAEAGEPFRRACAEALERGAPTQFEAWFEPAGLWLEAHVYPSEDGLTVFLRDITQARHAAEELTLRAAEARELLATLDLAAVMVRDMDGTIRFWSEGCERLYGYSAEEAVGQNMHELLQTDFLLAREEVEQSLAEQGSWTGDLRHRRRDGTPLVIAVRKELRRDPAGEPLAVMVSLSDVTALRAAEAGLRQLNAELEERVSQEVAAREAAQTRAAHAERMQALGQLAGGIAHDFNNVLQAVSGAVGLIAAQVGQEPLVLRMAGIAEAAAARGASITHRLLAFARRGDLRAEPLPAAAVLAGVQDMLAHTLGAGIAVQVQAGEDLPPMLADRGQLETVLVNLATNGRDSMPQGGTLAMVASLETVLPGQGVNLSPGSYVRLTVSDTGTGMDPAILKRVTEPFFTTKPVGQGTGLGLSIAKGFAEQSGGGLAIDSREGMGTNVHIWLPCADTGAGQHVLLEAAPGHHGRALRVLLSDDNELVRQALGAGLEELGWDVIDVPDGRAALQVLDGEAAVDVLVTDLSMPGLDGLATINAAQRRRPGLPAVLLTGYAHPGAEMIDDPPFLLLRKPVSSSELAACIREAVRPVMA